MTGTLSTQETRQTPWEKRGKGCMARIVPNYSAFWKHNESRVTQPFSLTQRTGTGVGACVGMVFKLSEGDSSRHTETSLWETGTRSQSLSRCFH